MASVVLSGLGGSLGSSVMGTIGRTIGSAAGSLLGQMIDTSLFSANERESAGARMDSLNVQSASYGRPIPVIYGAAKLAGNIIWATKLEEKSNISVTQSGSKYSRVRHTHTSYSYSISLAIAICEGPILDIEQMWANDVCINMSAYKIRVYLGDEKQMPDTLISSIQGYDQTPAYRGLAYVVIEDLELSEFGNRLPNFSFEVRKRDDFGKILKSLEDRIEEIIMIPGSGEFVYDTQIQTKVTGVKNEGQWISYAPDVKINSHNRFKIANSLLSLKQLQETLPNVKWIAPVIGWFANSLDAAKTDILPGVEFKEGGTVIPEEWSVAEFSRESAYEISKTNLNIHYGGTPSDGSILRYFQELKHRGFKVMIIPMFFIDTKDKPWRGRMSCTPEEVSHFFHKRHGYNHFILHYANLLKGLVDAFIIGSELVALTQIMDNQNQFPAVQELVSLARQVRQILGNKVQISYAADWAEYHHSQSGWYHLDELWASHDIDFIGIDAYFPLTDVGPGTQPTISDIKKGWDTGQLQEFYFDDRGIKKSLTPEWAIKNIEYWWNNQHINPNGRKTAWVPRSKKIWFTELGFPSVTASTNQPNVFYDPTSTESKFPNKSTGEVDFTAQRKGLLASLTRWANSHFIEKKFIWTWDARPYPQWPLLVKSWSDGGNWTRGHWIQGKVGITSLAKILLDLCLRSGFELENIDIDSLALELDIGVQGLVIMQNQAIKKIIENLAFYYNFLVIENGDQISFRTKSSHIARKLDQDSLIPSYSENGMEVLSIKRVSNSDLPSKVCINYIDKLSGYRFKSKYFTRDTKAGHRTLNLHLPIIASDIEVSNIANMVLYLAWSSRNLYSFNLQISEIALQPGELLEINLKESKHLIRVSDIDISGNNTLKVRGISEEFKVISCAISSDQDNQLYSPEDVNGSKTQLVVLDLPLLRDEELSQDPRVLVACYPEEKNWYGCKLYYLDPDNGDYIEVTRDSRDAATVGTAVNALGIHNHYLIDVKNQLQIYIKHGQLESIKEDKFLAGGNLALLGNEIISFKDAVLEDKGRYMIKELQRGLYGTERYIANHKPNERFVLLNHSLCSVQLPSSYINRALKWVAVSHGDTIEESNAVHEKFLAQNLVPLSPVHLKKKGGTLSWNRRIRGRGIWQDFLDIPLQEDKELYEVQYSNGSWSRTVVVYEPQIALTHLKLEKGQKYDFRVKQISSKTGCGLTASTMLEH